MTFGDMSGERIIERRLETLLGLSWQNGEVPARDARFLEELDADGMAIEIAEPFSNMPTEYDDVAGGRAGLRIFTEGGAQYEIVIRPI